MNALRKSLNNFFLLNTLVCTYLLTLSHIQLSYQDDSKLFSYVGQDLFSHNIYSPYILQLQSSCLPILSLM